MTTNEQRWQRLGEMIVERRLALDWTQQKLSLAAGVSAQVISDLENGRRADYQVPTLVKVQQALGWQVGSIQDVLDGGQPTERPDSSLRPA
jgi:transcriptional regulator with XRE-family HTH domain